jgi:SAM-dependent methyltransferase
VSRRRTRAAPSEPHGGDLLERGTRDHYLDVDLYDFEYADRTADVEWYRDFVAQHARGGTVVELGAGSGRITVPLARDGHTVVAVDRMPTMLAGLARKLTTQPAELRSRVTPLEADIRRVPTPDRSATVVLCPFNTLMHLYTWRDLLACFQEIARILQPGGWFALDVQVPDLRWLCWDADVRHAITPFRHPTTGERLVYSTNHVYDPATQICHVRIYYDAPPPGRRRFPAHEPPPVPRRIVHLAHRQIFPEELRALADRAGLELDPLRGDFALRGDPAGALLAQGCESQVATGRRPR